MEPRLVVIETPCWLQHYVIGRRVDDVHGLRRGPSEVDHAINARSTPLLFAEAVCETNYLVLSC